MLVVGCWCWLLVVGVGCRLLVLVVGCWCCFSGVSVGGSCLIWLSVVGCRVLTVDFRVSQSVAVVLVSGSRVSGVIG